MGRRSPRPMSLALAVALGVSVAAQADPWKDESGQDRTGREGRGGPTLVVPVPAPVPQGHYGPPPGYPYGPPPGGYAEPHIPQGHMPPPGECRVWFPDRSAGHQPPPCRC